MPTPFAFDTPQLLSCEGCGRQDDDVRVVKGLASTPLCSDCEIGVAVFMESESDRIVVLPSVMRDSLKGESA
jgi:formylmethanofuran dehydrogenase subunit B